MSAVERGGRVDWRSGSLTKGPCPCLWPFPPHFLPACEISVPHPSLLKRNREKSEAKINSEQEEKKSPVIFSVNCWWTLPALTAEAQGGVLLPVCVTQLRYSAADPDTWVRSGSAEGITNRWLLVPLIPYTVKQAFLENSHFNMSILRRELERRVVQLSEPPSTPHPKSLLSGPPPWN